jgi:hypothetical protein
MNDDTPLAGALQRIIPNRGKTPVTVLAETAEALHFVGLIEKAPELGPNTWKPVKAADSNQIRDWLGHKEWERQVLDGQVPMLYIEHREKPENATYHAHATIESSGWGQMTPGEYGWGGHVKIAWYENRVKITLAGATPAAITQAYLTGSNNDVVIELSKAGPSQSERQHEELGAQLAELEARRTRDNTDGD